MVFLNIMKLNKNATKLFITDAIAAPFTPNAGFGTNIKLNINFNATPINDVIAGTIILPNPCNAPFVVCNRTANIIVKENICSKKINPTDKYENLISSIENENYLEALKINSNNKFANDYAMDIVNLLVLKK